MLHVSVKLYKRKRVQEESHTKYTGNKDLYF